MEISTLESAPLSQKEPPSPKSVLIGEIIRVFVKTKPRTDREILAKIDELSDLSYKELKYLKELY